MSKALAPYPIGIDFGTSSSTAAWIDSNERLRQLEGRDLLPFVPSIVWYGPEDQKRVGWGAQRMLEDDPKNTATDFKRLLGRFFHAPNMKKYTANRAVRTVADVDGYIALDAGIRVQRVEQITSEIYHHIRQLAQAQSHMRFDSAVLTVPTNFGLLQRKAIRQAARSCPWQVKALLNEPTAAAFSFLATQDISGRVLVFDLGGGTLDLTILERRGGSVNILATDGDEFLGGRDLENRVTKWVASEFERKTGFNIFESKVAFERLNESTRRAMHLLDKHSEATIYVPSIGIHQRQIIDLSTIFSRMHLETISAPFMRQIEHTLHNLFTHTGIDIKSVDHVVFVGAATRSPLLRRQVISWTGGASTTDIDPRIAVACGAALVGRHLNTDGLNISYDMVTKDVHLYTNEGLNQKIIPNQTRVPFSTTIRLSAKRHSGHVFIGEYDGDGDESQLTPIGLLEIPQSGFGLRKKDINLCIRLDNTYKLSVSLVDVNGRERPIEVQHPFDISS